MEFLRKFTFNSGNFYETFILVFDGDYVSLISDDEVQWVVTEAPCSARIIDKIEHLLERLENRDVPVWKVRELMEEFIQREMTRLSFESFCQSL